MELTGNYIEFTKDMKKEYTILVPNMAPIHFELLKSIFLYYEYNVELLSGTGQEVVDMGLRFVHNDTCYPALLCVGQYMQALFSGKYDLDKVALLMTQTGGGCRASNYIHLIRKALQAADMGHIPVISANLSGLEKNSGFKITVPMLKMALAALVYGDLLMELDNQVKPYEINQGESAALVTAWVEKLSSLLVNGKAYARREIKNYCKEILNSFDTIAVQKTDKVKVGIVGEIFVKYSPLANNGLENFLHKQGCEVKLPGMFNFFLYSLDNKVEEIKLYGGNWFAKKIVSVLMNYMCKYESILVSVFKKYSKFSAPATYAHVKKKAEGIIGRGCAMGEGWLLTAEMLSLIEHGFQNIVCTQPFGCLPNHIVGRGMVQKIKAIHSGANIVPIDYDPGATKVNQENRIKLMLAMAQEQL